MSTYDLSSFGLSPFFLQQLESTPPPHLLLGRVLAAHGSALEVMTREGPLSAVVAGRIRHAAASAEQLPTTGDWVVLHRQPGATQAQIVRLLERKTCLKRSAAGRSTEVQLIAVNVDTIFITTSLNEDYNVRRVERYLSAVWDSGARPVILLTKADLVPDTAPFLATLDELALGVDIHCISALTGEGLGALAPYLQAGQTVAFVGTSGVGKSTLVNRLLEQDVQRVRGVRLHDDRGQHTTTHRALFPLPGGALLLDTPGMRELQLWSMGDGTGAVFEDVESLAARCRFRDCRHQEEPGCAVRKAVEDETLEAGRLNSYHKLLREQRWHRIRQDGRARQEAQREWKARTRAYRATKKQVPGE